MHYIFLKKKRELCDRYAQGVRNKKKHWANTIVNDVIIPVWLFLFSLCCYSVLIITIVGRRTQKKIVKKKNKRKKERKRKSFDLECQFFNTFLFCMYPFLLQCLNKINVHIYSLVQQLFVVFFLTWCWSNHTLTHTNNISFELLTQW